MPHGGLRCGQSQVSAAAGTSASPSSAELIDFVRSHTTRVEVALVPEIDLELAHDSHRIFEATRRFDERHPDAPTFPPYWAFAWPGGQAMARHILDAPKLVRGLRIADIGSGSGIGALAAAKAGARHVTAIDIDPLAATAITLNATLNGTQIEVSAQDCLGDLPAVDVILISDLVYEPELAVRVGAFLERALAAGLPVLMADRLSARRPARGFEEVARYDAPLTPALCEGDAEQGRVWRRR